jgi:hypothetical protein
VLSGIYLKIDGSMVSRYLMESKMKMLNSSSIPQQENQSVFGIACSGAALSNDDKLSLVGDFLGKVRIFENYAHNCDIRIKLVASISVGSSVQCIHMH